MATYDSTSVGVLMVGGYDILGTRTAIDLHISQPLEDTTALGVGARTYVSTGYKLAKLKQSGFYNDAAGSSNAALVGLTGTSQVGVINVEGNTVGKHFTGLSGTMQADYTRTLVIGKLDRADANFEATGAIEDDGIILFAEGAAAAATANGVGQNNTASSALGGSGYLECSSITLGGYTNLAVKVQDSADNATFADLVTFTVITAAPTAERIALGAAATVRQYIRSTYTYTGAGSAQTANLFVGFVRN